jgi:predicted acylesterase/phospholipase RssA
LALSAALAWGCAPALAPGPKIVRPASVSGSPDLSPVLPSAPKDRLAIIVGGGVSLGAYQAGYLYTLSEELKREGARPVLYVGASAGTINALLMAVEMCYPSAPDPALSPLRTAWMDASLAVLRSGVNTSPTAVFPQDGVRSIAQILRTRLTRGIAKDCDFVIAVETSRLRPRPIPIKEHDTIPYLQEPFTIRVTVAADGFPRIRNYVADDLSAPSSLLPFPVDQDSAAGRNEAMDQLIDLVLASSAFPGAFPQVALRHCMTDPSDRGSRQRGPTECGKLQVYTRTPFVDGGILDNTPVDLAIQTAQGGWLSEGSSPGWSVQPHAVVGQQPLPPGLAYLFVDTGNDVYDPLPAPPPTLGSFTSFAASFATGFIDAARGRSLYDTVERYPDLRTHLTVSSLHPRLASRFLFDFFGFFDTRLRDFDFTGGMYDAARSIADESLQRLLAGRAQPAGDASWLATLKATNPIWQKLACMAQAYGATPSAGGYDACATQPFDVPPHHGWQGVDEKEVGTDFESFVELLQASLDEAYSQCACARALSDRPLGEACRSLLAAGPAPARLREQFTLGRDWEQVCIRDPSSDRRSESIEDPFHYAIRRFAHYGFAGASEATTNAMVRDRIGTLADDAVARQPFELRTLATLAGPLLADTAFVYSPPQQSLHLVGGLATEAGWTYGRWLRASVALQVQGWRDAKLAFTPLAGVDWNLPGLPAALQLHAFARAGFQLGNTASDEVVTTPCWGSFGGHAANCVVGQAGAAVTLFELFRVQGLWEQASSTPANTIDHVLVEFGFQANWPIGPR